MSGYLITTYALLTNLEVKKFAFLTKPMIKMAGYRPSSFFSVFMDRDDVEVHKNGKKERGLCPSILTEHAWSKRIYHTAKRFRFIKNQEWIVYFESRERRESCVCSTINPRELFMLSFYHFFLHLNSVIDSASFHSSYKLSYCQTPQQECLEGMINNS